MSVEMKDSGIAWIGEIPRDWNVCRLKNIGELHGRIGWNGLRSDEFEDNSYAYLVTGQDFRSTEIEWNKCYQIRKERYDEDPFIQLENGDILITKDGTIGKIAVVSNMDKPACLNSGIFVLRQKGAFVAKYLFWFLFSPLLKTFNDYMNLGGTTIIHLYQNVFERMPLLIPPIDEQSRIANFLDKKCAEIDELIALQEQMIAQLTTYKQAVITETVTKGLDPNVKMKDSGVEWIGEIPEHWDKDKIIRMFKTIGSGTTPKSTEDSNFQGTINWLQSGDINGNIITESKHKISLETLKEYSVLKIYKAPFIVVAMYGASVGNISISDIDACVNQACCVMSNSNHDFRFLFYTIKSAKNYLIYRAVGGGQPNISQDTLKNLWLPNPPLSEQQSIANYLDQKCKEIDELISVKKEKIEKLKAYKKSVIYEYVTGKKQVN